MCRNPEPQGPLTAQLPREPFASVSHLPSSKRKQARHALSISLPSLIARISVPLPREQGFGYW